MLVAGEFNYAIRRETAEYQARDAQISRYQEYFRDANIRIFYIEEDVTSTLTTYYLAAANREYKIYNGVAEPFDIGLKYDCIIMKIDNPNLTGLEGYELVYSDNISAILIKSQ